MTFHSAPEKGLSAFRSAVTVYRRYCYDRLGWAREMVIVWTFRRGKQYFEMGFWDGDRDRKYLSELDAQFQLVWSFPPNAAHSAHTVLCPSGYLSLVVLGTPHVPHSMRFTFAVERHKCENQVFCWLNDEVMCRWIIMLLLKILRVFSNRLLSRIVIVVNDIDIDITESIWSGAS